MLKGAIAAMSTAVFHEKFMAVREHPRSESSPGGWLHQVSHHQKQTE